MQAEVSQARPAPSLRIWAAGAALAGAVVATLVALPHPHDPAIAGFIAEYTRDAVAQTRLPDRLVVGLGSSLLWAAMPPRARAAGLSWVRISRNGLGPGYLSASVAVLEGTPPAGLMVDQNLLLDDLKVAAMDQMRDDVLRGLKKSASKFAPEVDLLQQIRAQQRQDAPCAALPPAANAAQLAAQEKMLGLAYRDTAPEPGLVAALRRLAARGVPVMIVDIQRSAPIERATAQDKQRWFARLQQVLPPGPKLSYHSGPSYGRGDLYCDGSHLNPEGKKLFQAWWWDELQKVMH